MQPLTYKPDDAHSAGIERITVDGKTVDWVVMACPRRGIVDAVRRKPDNPDQIKIDKRRKRILTKRYRGSVRVIFRDGTVDAGGGRGHPGQA